MAKENLDTHCPAEQHNGDDDQVYRATWNCSTDGVDNGLGRRKELISCKPLENSKWVKEAANS